MKCPECVKEDEKSTIQVGGMITTSMAWTPFYDEDGELHSHDPNTSSTSYSCSRGHKWSESYQHKCQCGWPRKQS